TLSARRRVIAATTSGFISRHSRPSTTCARCALKPGDRTYSAIAVTRESTNAAPYLARVCASRGNAIGGGLALWLTARRHQFIHSARRIFSRSLSASPSVAFITGRVHSSRRTSRIERMRRWIHDHGCFEARPLRTGRVNVDVEPVPTWLLTQI